MRISPSSFVLRPFCAFLVPALLFSLSPFPSAFGQDASTPGNVATSPRGMPGRDALVARAMRVGDEWFGLYVLGQKAGSMFTGVRMGEHEGKAALVSTYATVLNATVGGNVVRREVRGERVYDVTSDGRLLFFHEERRGDGGDERLTGRCTTEGVHLVREPKGQAPQTLLLPATRENLDDALAAMKVLTTGAPHTGHALDLDHRMADKRVTTALSKRHSQSIDGEEVQIAEITVTEEDSRVSQSMWMSPDGRTREIRYGNVLMAKAEPREVAEQQGHIDVFGSTRVVLGGKFSLDQKLAEHVRRPPSRVVYEIEGLPSSYWTSNAWQRFAPIAKTEDPERVSLTVTAVRPRSSLRLPLPQALIDEQKLDEWLRPTLAVESQAPEIVALTKRTLGKTTDAFSAVEKLSTFVYRFLKKSYGVSSDRATRVLELREGDCTEHALLFTAMARAAGIPARRVNGLVYMDTTDGIPSLYWHEWVEAFVGEWIPVDPTFGQSVADAGHLAFGIEGQNDVAALFGQLRIKVVQIAKPELKPEKASGDGN